MGGSAFSAEGLLTPRMPTSVYEQTRDSVIAVLLSFYSFVQAPIEAPEKPDYGDVDIIVCSPLRDFSQKLEIDNELATAIGATHHKTGKPTSNFAIPWSRAAEKRPNATDAVEMFPAEKSKRPIFIQVDISTVGSPASFKWQVFNHSHGDLWNMVGSLIRGYGLTASNSGIYVRIAELEPLNKTAARLLLTSDPTEALKFLGMEEERYWRPFPRKRDLFKYVSTCRFYDPMRFGDRAEMKANDRQRIKKRSLFHEWVDQYLPTVRESQKGEWAEKSREDILGIVKAWFGVGERFEKQKRDELTRIRRQTIWSEIRKDLPIEGTRLGIAMKGLKADIAGTVEGQPAEDSRNESEVRKWFEANDFDAVKKWAMDHWAEIEEQQNQKERVACAMHFQRREMAKAEEEKITSSEEH